MQDWRRISALHQGVEIVHMHMLMHDNNKTCCRIWWQWFGVSLVVVMVVMRRPGPALSLWICRGVGWGVGVGWGGGGGHTHLGVARWKGGGCLWSSAP